MTKIFATLREPTWWAWLVTGGLLFAGVLGSRDAFAAAMLFALVQYAYFAAGDDSRLPLTAQVRLAFALMLAVFDAAGVVWLCWVVFAGTLVRLAFGYCLLGRMLLLLPWNRDEPISLDLVRLILLTPPSPFVSESRIAADAPPASGRRDDANVSLAVFPPSTPVARADNRIDRAVSEAKQRRSLIANAWRNPNTPWPSGLTDRQELDCAS